MNKKIRVGILFGGKSAEHEVSLQSAKNVADAINKDKYEVSLIGIDKSGRWLLPNQSQFLLNESNPKLIKLNGENEQSVTLIPQSGGQLTNLTDEKSHTTIDVIFPILHGPFGEDGTVQGLLKLANIPFVGASVLGSAIGMDKDVMKRLLRDAGIPVAKFLVFKKGDDTDFETVSKELGMPTFVKPANLGSSVGVSKVKNKEEFEKDVSEAFQYDSKILDKNSVNFIFGGGAGNMPVVGTILHGWGGKVIYLYDNDQGKKDGEKNLKDNWLVTKDLVLAVLNTTGSIEDIFSPSNFREFVLGDTSKTYTESNSEYVKKSKLDKVLLAKNFLETCQNETPINLDTITKDNLTNLFENIESKFKIAKPSGVPVEELLK